MMRKNVIRLKFAILAIALASISWLSPPAMAGPLTINGAGASFPFPVYAQWAYRYEKLNKIRVNYQSIGSGGGIRQIKARTVDFGASDAPLKPVELKRAGLIQFPLIMGGVAPVVNIRGIEAGKLRLTPELLSDIFLGRIVKWDDPAIEKVNPGLKLPGKMITVVHRADGSGTTWIFTNYLDKVSPDWHEAVGTAKAVQWPVGVGGKGNEGVATYVRQVSGSIGYVEYAYALQNKLTYVLLKNKSGNFVAPTSESFQAAAANADWKNSPGFYVVLTDQPGDGSWPITGASFILIYREQTKPALAKEVLSFFDWCYKHGAELAAKLDYVPMPESVFKLVEKTWKTEISAGGKPVWP